MKVRTPPTDEAATALLDRHATLEGELAAIEANRATALASTNAVADALALPIITETAAIAAALEPWWSKVRDRLTAGKRKSIELGGCVIGTRSGRAKLGVAGDEDLIVDKMKRLRWARDYLRTTTAIDKAAVAKGFLGKRDDRLKALGFSIVPGAETFFVERAPAGAGDTVAR